MSLLESLVVVSEKAANIARICRQDRHLFELLVQKKADAESNPRFVQDFKTLADVLIQETVKHDLGRQFPALRDHVKGEENNTFCNKLGESIRVEIQSATKKTADLLEVVLNGDARAAMLLAQEVHREVLLADVNTTVEGLSTADELNYEELGVWIDPIDSTAEYINGREFSGENGIFLSGLRCVTVLIGVFHRKSGIPLMGVVNQPFYEQSEEQWRGHCHWGIASCKPSSVSSFNCCTVDKPTNIICLSSSEDAAIKSKLRKKGFRLVEAAGAGYKILTVIVGQADAYVLSKDTTFKWDTCGPQAILRSLGGDLLSFDDAVRNACRALEYGDESQAACGESKIATCCNTGGVIAYRDEEVLKDIIRALNSDN